MLANCCYAHLYLLATSLRVLALGVSVDDDEVEPIVEAEDRSETDGHVQSRGRVQSPEIRGNYVKFEAVALGYPSYVPAQWFVGGAIRQEERARRHASVKEIWCSGGVVR